jgi:hypothetical protein
MIVNNLEGRYGQENSPEGNRRKHGTDSQEKVT